MQQPNITLTVQQGHQRGQRFSLAKDSIILGRVIGSDVVISDAEVSRRHASITWERGQPVIRDLGSTNGTFVNGVRITGPRVLRDGDTIGLGKIQLGFQCPALAGARQTTARPALPAEAGRGPGGLSWLALGLFGLAAVILLIAVAIGAYIYTQQEEEVAGVPTVFINSPPNGSQVPVGQEVIVQAAATDSQGVTRVELLVNGVLYHSDVSPNPQGQSPFIYQQSWQASAPGTYTLMLRVYNAAGGVSQSAGITVNVVGPTTPGPGQPTATPGEPAATPTVTSTPAPGMPTATWTPVIIVVTDTPTPTPTGCTLDVAFVADVTVPDGTVFEPGASFDKIWRIRNSGNCPWESGYTWVFVSGDQMGAPPSQLVPATAVGANVDIGVAMDAPNTPGTYTGYWRMRSPDGQVFGQTCSVQIVVLELATATPTTTPTPTPTVTPTPTATPPQPPPIIEFWVDDNSITAGQCTKLHWHIEQVNSAFLDGNPVTGPLGEQEVCPASTTTYTLHVVKLDSSTEDKTVTVNVTPAPPAEHTVTLNSVSGEDGHVRQDGTLNPYPNVGDGSGDIALQAFLSFDVSGIPAGATIESASLDLSTGDMLDDPFAGLGWMRVYNHQYGTLDAGDFTPGFPTGAMYTFDSRPNAPFSSSTLNEKLQAQVNGGSPRFQIRIQFQSYTDNDHQGDCLRLGEGKPILVITYTD